MDKTEQVSVYSNDTGTTVVGIGALDLYNENFCTAIRDAAQSAENVTVDLQSATYIDTAILACLAVGASRMLNRDKRLKVRLLEGTHPLRTLKMAGLSQIMDLVVENVQETE